MAEPAREARPGDLSWRLSSHPITLIFFLGFRICTFQIQCWLSPANAHDSVPSHLPLRCLALDQQLVSLRSPIPSEQLHAPTTTADMPLKHSV